MSRESKATKNGRKYHTSFNNITECEWSHFQSKDTDGGIGLKNKNHLLWFW
jgi:hypothetical protein